ncbi:MAG: SDR family oxidoreductase [Bacteroidota bacterium]
MKNLLLSGLSRGLGLELARQLLARGYQIFGISRSKTEALAALQALHPQRLHWQACDLAQPALLKEQVFGSLIPKDLPIHGLINNAAIAYDDLLTNVKMEPLEQMFAVNVYSPMMLCREVIRNMLLHRQGGSLVHLSSVCAHTGYKGLSMYAASKGALEAFSRTLAREWGPKEIRSNCVVAGFMETEMSAGLSEEQKAKIYRRNALQGPAELASVASTVIYLLEEGAASITGQEIIVDSGSL